MKPDYINEALRESLDELEPQIDYWVSEVSRRQGALIEAQINLEDCERKQAALTEEIRKRDAERL